MASLVVCVADMHINSTVALSPPVFNLDGGGKRYQTDLQAWIWRSWCDFFEKVKQAKEYLGCEVYVIFNGDLVDINTHSKYGLMSPNDSDVLNNSIVALKPALDVADYKFVVRGTEAHTGGASWLEEQIAKLIGAEKDTIARTWSWYWLPLQIQGVNMGFAHHPATNSTRPWTRGNAAARQAMILMDEFWGEDKEDIPELVSYGHFHHDEDSFDNHKRIRVIYQCPWIGTTAYDSRCGRASQRPKIGGNIIYVNDGKYKVRKIRYTIKRRKPWTPS